MIGDSKVLGLIPARGGSKRLTRKNVRPFAGKPLIAWTIDAARASATIDRTVLSSEDPEIIATARAHGCEVPFIRPAELATDQAASIDVVFHAIEAAGAGYEFLVLLQPTSPLRTAGDIDACVRLCATEGVNTVVSVTEAAKPVSHFGLTAADGRFAPFRPGAGQLHMLNGAVYVARIAALRRSRTFFEETTRAYVMPVNRSFDIDDEADFLAAEAAARR